MFKNISIILVAAGSLLLLLSLLPTRNICRRDEELVAGWKFLGVLICAFVVGCLLFSQAVWYGPTTLMTFVVSTMVFCGGLFVYLVVRLSSESIDKIETLVEKERHRALHDDLTGLANRTLLEERLDYAILMSKRRRETFAVLGMDLVRFKQINDSLGHFYGDYVLQEVASRLKSLVRESDTLARVGGDEFVYVLPKVTVEQAIKISHKVAVALDEPFRVEGYNLNVGVSIGIAMYPEHGVSIEALVKCADIAMYEAKKNDVIYEVYQSQQNQATLDRLVLIGQLREAIAKEQLFLMYQPKVSAQDGGFAGVEALVRWQHPKRGMVPPDEFIPLVEQAGLSKPLTHWVLNSALAQSARWAREGSSVAIAVNLSVKNLHDYSFAEEVEALLEKWQVDPKLLILEITESCMMVDPQRVNKVVNRLKDLGLRLSIDDFGTGYSSVSYLRNFPAKEIKIDKSFVTDILNSEENAIIVKSTIEMIHNIGCTVVAEGVEDEETGKHLASLGCDYLQGFYISKPLPVEEVVDFLKSNNVMNVKGLPDAN